MSNGVSTFKPTSQAQFQALVEGRTPEPERLNDSTFCVPLPIEHGFVHDTLCYVLEGSDGRLHLIDPGTDTDENWGMLKAGLARFGTSVDSIASIVVTHMHPDHLGMAQRVHSETGALIAMHGWESTAISSMIRSNSGTDRWEQWGVPRDKRPVLDWPTDSHTWDSVHPDVLLDDDQLLDIAGRRIRVLWTPGHTYGHICLRDEEAGVLFSGDHILPMIYPGLGLGGPTPTSPIGHYIESLHRVAEHDDEVAPGHGYRFEGLAERCGAIEAHHLRRSEEVGIALAKDPQASVWEVASQVTWSAGWENLNAYILSSALSQTSMHMQYLTESAAAHSG